MDGSTASAFSSDDSGSPSLMLICTSMAWRLLFIAGENALLMVVTLKKYCFVVDTLLCQIVLLCSVSVLVFISSGNK